MATYLVTGGCGFIGSHLAEMLQHRGNRGRALDNLSTGKIENIPSATEVMIGDIVDNDVVEAAMEGVSDVFISLRLHPSIDRTRTGLVLTAST